MKKNYLLLAFTVFLFGISYGQKTKTLKYKDNVVAKEKWHDDDDKIDSLKTYYKTGQLNEAFYFDDEQKYHGVCYQQNEKGERLTSWNFKHGKLKERIDHIKSYNVKNKEHRLSRYKKIELLNTELNTKFHYGKMMSRAYNRYSLGNYVLAQNDFQKIKYRLEQYKGKSKALIPKRLASVYDVLGSIYSSYELENSAIHYKYLAMRTDAKASRLMYNFGSYLTRLKHYKLGIHFLNEVLKDSPKHAFANWALGIAYTDLEEYDLALKYIDLAYEREKNIYKFSTGKAERDLSTMKGYLHHKLGDTEIGIEELQKAIEVQDDNSFAMRYLGEVYFDIEDYKKSCEILNEAKELGYQKKHDRDDLQYFIDQSCFEVENDYVSPKNLAYITPNPVINVAEINNFSVGNTKFIVKNYRGTIVLEGVLQDNKVDFSALKPGLYVLLVNGKKDPISIKFIKE